MPSKDYIIQNRINVLLKEYQSTRDEILHQLTHLRQILVLILGSVSIVVPLVFDKFSNLQPTILIVLLYLLSIIYSVVSMNAVTMQFEINVSGYYIKSYIEPRINELLSNDKKEYKAIYWDDFMSGLSSKPSIFVLRTMGTVGTVLLMILPAGISLYFAETILIPNLSTADSLISLLNNVLTYLQWFSWIIYVISVAGWIAIIFVGLFTFKMATKSD